ncbi:hypothetical protein SSS_06600 [Sarcoptes scabiei]|nr:hypothetical protein SSS_06600 [Sarcoptes scabiei]
MSRISRIKQRLMTRHSFIQIDHRQCRTFSRNLNFLDLINTNKTESKKLILIENIDSSSSSSRGNFSHLTKNVLSDNLKIKIDQIWNYTYRRRQFVLARLNQLNDIDQIQSRCDFHQHSLPVRSRMLETSLKIPNHIADDQSSTYNQRCFEYPNSPSMNNYQNFKHRQLNELKEKYPSNEFIGRLIEQNSLNELDIQLRYFIITQLEEILCGSVFRDFQIFPFGSSLALVMHRAIWISFCYTQIIKMIIE